MGDLIPADVPRTLGPTALTKDKDAVTATATVTDSPVVTSGSKPAQTASPKGPVDHPGLRAPRSLFSPVSLPFVGGADSSPMTLREGYTLTLDAGATVPFSTQSYQGIRTSIDQKQIPGGAQGASATGAARLFFGSKYIDASVSGIVSAQASTPGNQGLTDLANAGLAAQPSIKALTTRVKAAQATFNAPETKALMADLKTQAAILGGGGSSAAKFAAAAKLLADYDKLKPLVAQMDTMVQTLDQQMATMEGLAGKAHDGTQSLSVSAGAAGSLEFRMNFRTPNFVNTENFRMNAGLTAHAHLIPGTLGLDRVLPDGSPTLEGLAAQADGKLTVKLAGTDSLRETLKAAKDMIGAYKDAKPLLDDPTSALTKPPAETKKTIAGLETAANTLTKSFETMQKQFSADANLQVDVTQPTSHLAVGVGAGLAWSAGHRDGSGWQYRGSAMIDNLGYAPGTTTHYALSEHIDGSGREAGTPLTKTGTSGTHNVFNTFWPVTLTTVHDLKAPTDTHFIAAASVPLGGNASVFGGINQQFKYGFGVNAGDQYTFGRDGATGSNMVTAGVDLLKVVHVQAGMGTNSLAPNETRAAMVNLGIGGSW